MSTFFHKFVRILFSSFLILNLNFICTADENSTSCGCYVTPGLDSHFSQQIIQEFTEWLNDSQKLEKNTLLDGQTKQMRKKILKSIFIVNVDSICKAQEDAENCDWLLPTEIDRRSSEERIQEFVELYNELEKLENTNSLDEEGMQMRRKMLKPIFLSFRDPKKNVALYEAFLQKTTLIFYAEDINAIDKEDLDLNDFKSFLAFYAIGSEQYESLPEFQQKFIVHLNKRFKILLN